MFRQFPASKKGEKGLILSIAGGIMILSNGDGSRVLFA
jgi:hypothetical protein